MIVVDQSYVVTALITAYNNLGNNQETLGIYSVGYLKQSKRMNNSSHMNLSNIKKIKSFHTKFYNVFYANRHKVPFGQSSYTVEGKYSGTICIL